MKTALRNTILMLVLGLAMVGTPVFASSLSSVPVASASIQHKVEKNLRNPAIGDDGRIGVMIVLQGEPAVFAYQRSLLSADASGASGVDAARSAGVASREVVHQLAADQAQLMDAIGTLGIGFEELFRTQRVLNGVALRVHPADIARLAKLPGVATVKYLPYETPSNITSVPFIGAPKLWTGIGSLGLPSDATGDGVRIGIIDSGIDYQHPDFGGSGKLIDYQKNGDRTRINPVNPEDPNSPNFFPTAKVVGGFDFTGDAYNGGNSPHPDPNPADCLGHGSHVAGTVAGYGEKSDGTTYIGTYDPVPDYAGFRIGPGVAPGAQLYALRIFGCGGGTNLLSEAIEWATDPNQDGDMSDHLDIINMSLGGTDGFESDVDAIASDNAALTGMIVVAAAGNAGDAFFVHGSPAAGRHVIAVAAIADSGVAGTLLRESAPSSTDFPASAAAYSNPDGSLPPAPSGQSGELVLVDDGIDSSSDGCQLPFLSDVSGKIALIDRNASTDADTCFFTDKVLNAQSSGAVGVVIADSSDEAIPVLMGGQANSTISIPGISVPKASGAILKQQLAIGGVSVTLSAANAGDTFASFSSRGPVADFDGSISLKPDLSAPGVNIPSVLTGVTCDGVAQFNCFAAAPGGYIPGGQSLTISGTSMATPHVAGMMAILRQLNPTASPDELKMLAMNTAAHDVTIGANGSGPLLGARSVGAGRVDLVRAATDVITAANDDVEGVASVTFDIEPVAAGSVAHTVRVFNHSVTPRTIDLSIDPIDDAPGVSFTAASPSIAVPALGSATVNIAMDYDTTQMKRYCDPTIGRTATSVLGYSLARECLAEKSALLKISQSGIEMARLPLYAAFRPHSSLTTAGMPAGAPASGTVLLSPAGPDVCTGPRDGTGCAAELSSDEISLVSQFELQVTGLRNTAIPGFANLRYVGVNYLPKTSTDDGFVLFGISAYGKWGSPSTVSYNICIDTDGDGFFDKVLFNTDTGTSDGFFGAPPQPSDGYFSMVFDRGLATFERPLNIVGADFADTAVLDNNVMFMGAHLATLGLDEPGRISYGIAVCPGGDPLCAAFTLPAKTCTANDAWETFNGPYTYDASHPGLDGAHLVQQDIDGNPIELTYDTANLGANRSRGLLLLHHHNTSDKTAEVVIVDRLFGNGFQSPP